MGLNDKDYGDYLDGIGDAETPGNPGNTGVQEAISGDFVLPVMPSISIKNMGQLIGLTLLDNDIYRLKKQFPHAREKLVEKRGDERTAKIWLLSKIDFEYPLIENGKITNLAARDMFGDIYIFTECNRNQNRLDELCQNYPEIWEYGVEVFKDKAKFQRRLMSYPPAQGGKRPIDTTPENIQTSLGRVDHGVYT